MLRLYTGVAAVALLATGLVGFSEAWGFDPLSGFYHAGMGAMFGYAAFFRRDATTVRQIVGGLGVLLMAIKAVTVLAVLLVYGRFEHGPVEVTCLVMGGQGGGSTLAARYLPEGRWSPGRRRSERRGR